MRQQTVPKLNERAEYVCEYGYTETRECMQLLVSGYIIIVDNEVTFNHFCSYSSFLGNVYHNNYSLHNINRSSIIISSSSI